MRLKEWTVELLLTASIRWSLAARPSDGLGPHLHSRPDAAALFMEDPVTPVAKVDPEGKAVAKLAEPAAGPAPPTAPAEPASVEKSNETEKTEKTESKEEAPCEPIPGSDKWGRMKSKPNTEPKGNAYCCARGCRYIVEKDKCDECKKDLHTVFPPQKDIDKYQENRKFRIPTGIDSYSGVVSKGCSKKNAVMCHDEEKAKVCCCNLGYVFDFKTRECVVDNEDAANKEDPIPGSQTWGFTHKKGAADKCMNDQKKWCCHRGCVYELEHDKCGHCAGYADPAPAPAEQVILEFSGRGRWRIPKSIDKPSWMRGKCSTKDAQACPGESSGKKDHCCCFQGKLFSFETRTCVDPPSLQKEEAQEYQAMQSQNQANAKEQRVENPQQLDQGPPPPGAPPPPAAGPPGNAPPEGASGGSSKAAAVQSMATVAKSMKSGASAQRLAPLAVFMLMSIRGTF